MRVSLRTVLADEDRAAERELATSSSAWEQERQRALAAARTQMEKHLQMYVAQEWPLQETFEGTGAPLDEDAGLSDTPAPVAAAAPRPRSVRSHRKKRPVRSAAIPAAAVPVSVDSVGALRSRMAALMGGGVERGSSDESETESV
jgi:hypothetical protein